MYPQGVLIRYLWGEEVFGGVRSLTGDLHLETTDRDQIRLRLGSFPPVGGFSGPSRRENQSSSGSMSSYFDHTRSVGRRMWGNRRITRPRALPGRAWVGSL